MDKPGFTLFRSLRHRNFRLYIVGQSLSLIGTWTQSTTMGWLVDRLTGSTRMQGIVGSIAQLPALLLPPFAGVLTDRFNRKHLLVTTQSLAMLQALALAALVAFGNVQVWHIIFFNFLLSAINAFDWPVRQTFIGDMLEDREDLANAIAMNSSLVNGSRLIGPALAAYLINYTGEAGGFLVNGVSFIAVIICLSAMRIPRRPRPPSHPRMSAGLKEGWSYVSRSKPIRVVLFVVAAVCLFGLPYSMLLPRYTHTKFDGTAKTYAVLMTAPGVGALFAGLFVVWQGMRQATLRIAISPIIAGVCLASVSWCTNLMSAAALMFGAGFGLLILINSANILLQSIAEPDKRGRVMSYYTIAFMGVGPIGNLLVPEIAERFGIPVALQVSGTACCLAGIYFATALPRIGDEIRKRLEEDHEVHSPTLPPDSAVETAAVIPAGAGDL